jgi:hypothetical protein
MRITLFLAGTLAAWVAAVPAAGQPADKPVRLEIGLDKTEYPFRGAIALTVTYTNTSKEAVVLMINGGAAGDGLAGEMFEVTSGSGRTAYTIFAFDPRLDKVTIEPGKSWKRTIKDLAPVLSNTGVAIDGKVPDGTGPLPDPFGRFDDFTLRLSFQSEVKNQPKPAFNGKVESNTLKFKVVLR